MKARVKATGQPIEISDYLKIYPNPRSTCYYFLKDLKFEKDSDSPDYWARLEHQAAIGAMQGLLQSPHLNIMQEEPLVGMASSIAHALVEKMKESV